MILPLIYAELVDKKSASGIDELSSSVLLRTRDLLLPHCHENKDRYQHSSAAVHEALIVFAGRHDRCDGNGRLLLHGCRLYDSIPTESVHKRVWSQRASSHRLCVMSMHWSAGQRATAQLQAQPSAHVDARMIKSITYEASRCPQITQPGSAAHGHSWQ